MYCRKMDERWGDLYLDALGPPMCTGHKKLGEKRFERAQGKGGDKKYWGESSQWFILGPCKATQPGSTRRGGEGLVAAQRRVFAGSPHGLKIRGGAVDETKGRAIVGQGKWCRGRSDGGGYDSRPAVIADGDQPQPFL